MVRWVGVGIECGKCMAYNVLKMWKWWKASVSSTIPRVNELNVLFSMYGIVLN